MGDETCRGGIQWKGLLRISIVGLLFLGHVTIWTVVLYLNEESHRLDRLIAAETSIQSDLDQLRIERCNTAKLEQYARDKHMVRAPVKGDSVAVGSLPAPDSLDTTVARIQPRTPPTHVVGTTAQAPTQAGLLAYQAQQPSSKLLTRTAVLIALPAVLYFVMLQVVRRKSRSPRSSPPRSRRRSVQPRTTASYPAKASEAKRWAEQAAANVNAIRR